MDPSDLGIYNQIEAWGDELTGYPTVSGYHEFLYEPDKPLRGDVVDYAYHQRGALAYTTELWDLFAQLGVARKKPFVDHYRMLTRADLAKLAQWDKDVNESRLFVPWKKATHPQLGEVEVGGMDTRIGLSNPPLEMIASICEKHSMMFLRVAAMSPAMQIDHVKTVPLGKGAWRVEVAVENRGYLPTYVLSSAKAIALDARVFVTAEASGVKLASDARVEAGHLGGWGRGLYDASTSIFHARSRGSSSRAVVSFTGEGKGVLRVTAEGLRVGAVHVAIEV